MRASCFAEKVRGNVQIVLIDGDSVSLCHQMGKSGLIDGGIWFLVEYNLA